MTSRVRELTDIGCTNKITIFSHYYPINVFWQVLVAAFNSRPTRIENPTSSTQHIILLLTRL
jgi:hypothetical protein